jgi:class 3 adenylate cyclase
VRDGADYAIKMGAYVSEAFMDLVMNEQSGLYPNVAVLFSDLRGFTTYAQGIQPDSSSTSSTRTWRRWSA